MTKVRIHYYKNDKWGRYHLPWIQYFSEYLKNFFSVELIDYYKGDGKWSGGIELQNEILYNRQQTKNPAIADTDFIIENISNGEIVIITFGKFFHHRIVHWMKNDKVKSILCAHYSDRHFVEHYTSNNCFDYADKVQPWIFGFFAEFDVDKYRELRDVTETLNSNLYFKGGGAKNEEGYRKVVYHLEQKNMLNTSVVKFDRYLEELAVQEIAFSHYLDLDYFKTGTESCGELCYRDIEMMSIGVPFIRIEYKSQLHKALIPNHHYICIPREEAFIAYNRGGDEAVADLVIEKYEQVKKNKQLLKFISNNQREWYDTYMRFPKSAELAMELSGINKW